MFKYIGIRGHRGAGKNTISYLLGCSIEYYIINNSWEGFDLYWDKLINEDIYKDNFINEASLNNVYFESFADTLISMVHTMLNIPTEWMYDDYLKDNVWINMKDFSYVKRDNKLDPAPSPIVTHKEMFTLRYNEIDTEDRPRTFRNDVYMSLRDIIYYFGYMMKSFFGFNTWVKSLDVNKKLIESFYASNKTIYKIFIDVKYPSEVTYIKNNGGIIIKTYRPDNVKEDSDISCELDFDTRVDYEVNINNLSSVKEVIINIVESIINETKNGAY